jgi:hypothetical protein
VRASWADGRIQSENCIGDFLVGVEVAAAAIKKDRAEHEAWSRHPEESASEEKNWNGGLKNTSEGQTSLADSLRTTRRLGVSELCKSIDKDCQQSGIGRRREE